MVESEQIYYVCNAYNAQFFKSENIYSIRIGYNDSAKNATAKNTGNGIQKGEETNRQITMMPNSISFPLSSTPVILPDNIEWKRKDETKWKIVYNM